MARQIRNNSEPGLSHVERVAGRRGKNLPVAILFFLLFSNCASHLTTRGPQAIEVKYQKIYLKPLQGLEKLATADYWPDSIWQGKFLVENMQQVWKGLLAELRRCEKYGLYTVVDSTASSTFEISVEIVSSKIKADTLFIPMKITLYQKTDKRSHFITVAAYGVFRQDTSGTNNLPKLVSAFMDYRHRFPYQKAVSLIYGGDVE